MGYTTEQIEAAVEAAGNTDNLSTEQRAELFKAFEPQPDGVLGQSGGPSLSDAATRAAQDAFEREQ